MEHGKRFCTVFTCIDGRAQALVHQWCKTELNADFPDTVTIAGCDRVLSQDGDECVRALSLARISIDKHGSRDAIIVGHSDCAGNMASNEEHCEHIRRASYNLAHTQLFLRVYGLFVDVRDERVNEVCRFNNFLSPGGLYDGRVNEVGRFNRFLL